MQSVQIALPSGDQRQVGAAAAGAGALPSDAAAFSVLARGTFTVSGLLQRPASPASSSTPRLQPHGSQLGPLQPCPQQARGTCARTALPVSPSRGQLPGGAQDCQQRAGSDRVASAAWLSARLRLWQWRCSPWRPAWAPAAPPPNDRRQALLLPAAPRQLVRPVACRVGRPIFSWAVQSRWSVPSRARSPCYRRLSGAPRSEPRQARITSVRTECIAHSLACRLDLHLLVVAAAAAVSRHLRPSPAALPCPRLPPTSHSPPAT